MSARRKPRRLVYVYLICLERFFHHTKHYLGSSVDPDRRLREHRSGNGSHYTKAVAAAGIEMEIVRLWQGERYDEVLLKLHKNSARYCPRCREEFLRRDRARRKAKREARRAARAGDKSSGSRMSNPRDREPDHAEFSLRV